VTTDETGSPAIAEAWMDVDDAGFEMALDTVEGTDDVPVPRTPATPVVTDLRSADEGRSIGVDHAELLWGEGRTDLARRIVAPDHVFRRARRDVEGRGPYLALVESYRTAFPDLRVTVRDVVAEGDRVVVRAAMTGTHEEPFDGIDPTGRRVEAHWTFVHEMADGRIVSTGMIDDHRWLLDQLSARPIRTGRTVEQSTSTGPPE
jgi:steroid delta-isomerase-like uncharacterized protein